MLTHIGVFVRGVRRLFNRSEWALRLLGLGRARERGAAKGLVMIQIDGLAFPQFRKALAHGRLPFVRSLIQRQGYVTHSHYSGLPSATPGVQGELFYGVKGCVPTFSFRDPASGNVFRMYDPKATAEIERRVAECGRGLLEGGSAYCDIFTGGAKESHFCAAQRGWGGLIWAAHPLILPFLLLLYVDVLIRTVILLVWEGTIGLVEAVRGGISGQDFLEELKFVVVRLGVCILLRELVIAGAQLDIARGLPIIHMNFFGYDEQSHRRGPASPFAHWALRGIDTAVARVWQAARASTQREHDVWIYSDHGQEATVPYLATQGRSLDDALCALVKAAAETASRCGPEGGQEWKTGLLSHRFFQRPGSEGVVQSEPERILVTGMGPLAQLYFPRPVEPAERERIASQLIEAGGVPLVLIPDKPGHVTAWTKTGIFTLPADAAQVLGADHPFLEEAAQDLVALCHHPYSGEMIVSGWQPGRPAMTFPPENGSHAGPGSQETHGFALLPSDAPLPRRGRAYLRPLDLREAAMAFLNRAPDPTVCALTQPAAAPATIRIMTYNVHRCIGMDGKLSPERIARVIARHQPDVVALQELDVHRVGTGGIHQAEAIAQKLRMTFEFHATYRLAEEQYGNAILSRFPMQLVRADRLPMAAASGKSEPRGALWVRVMVGGLPLQVITSHLSLWPRERLLQAEALVGADWLGHENCRGPVVVCGDFNAVPGSVAYQCLCDRLRDAQLALESHQPLRTWFGRYPVSRIDHVFVGTGIDVVSLSIPQTELEKVSSDHLPLLAELRIPDSSKGLEPPPGESARRPIEVEEERLPRPG